jgi:hypothetical protein
MCPRSDESAGKRRSTRLRHGAPWLKATLIQIAWPQEQLLSCPLSSSQSTSRAEESHRRCRRLEPNDSLSPARDGTVYQDLGMSHFDSLNRDRAAKSLVRRRQALGFEVDARPAAA